MEHPPSWAIEAATRAARKAWCAKDSRGVVVWDDSGRMASTRTFVSAANGPPPPFKCGGQAECRAACGKVAGHAEEAALWLWSKRADSLYAVMPPKMLHIKLENGVAVPGGPPSCVTCSRTMLMAGAAGIWLWLDAEHADGGVPVWRWYGAVEFHTLSLLHPRNNLPVIR